MSNLESISAYYRHDDYPSPYESQCAKDIGCLIAMGGRHNIQVQVVPAGTNGEPLPVLIIDSAAVENYVVTGARERMQEILVSLLQQGVKVKDFS